MPLRYLEDMYTATNVPQNLENIKENPEISILKENPWSLKTIFRIGN